MENYLGDEKMEIQDFLKTMVAQQRKKDFDVSNQLSLGEFILKLEHLYEKNKDKEDYRVCFHFADLIPTGFSSWRGSYDELAITFGSGRDLYGREDFSKIANLLKEAKSCVGKTFHGYKGGDFVMTKNTPLWVSNYGSSGSTTVVDVIDNGYEAIIFTGYRE